MAVQLQHVDGSSEAFAEPAQVDRLLVELETLSDEEHPDVAITLEDGWSISLFRGGRATLGHLDDLDIGPVHLSGLDEVEFRRLAHLMASGALDAVRSLPWQGGTPDD